MTLTMHDFRDAWRQWTRAPFVTLVALASLTFGLGLTLAVVTLVDAVLLKSLPVRDPHTLARVVADDTQFGRGQVDVAVTQPVWEYLREEQPFAAEVAAFATDRFNLARGGEVRYVTGLYTSGNGLALLGVQAAAGRAIAPADDEAGAPGVAMISHALWQRDYAGAPDAIGATLWVDQQPFTIVGVAPSSFYGLEVGRRVDVILPVSARAGVQGPAWAVQRDHLPWLAIYGRLAPDVALGDASAALLAWTPALRDATRPAGPTGDRHLVNPLQLVSGAQGLSWLRRQYAEPMVLLLGAVVLVWLIACANLAALVLARFTDRRHELGVRLALGASRGRLVRALLTESTLLSVAGAGLGLLLARSLLDGLVPFLTSPAFRGIPPAIDLTLDLRLAVAALTLAVLSALLAGLVPAWRATRVAPQATLVASTRRGGHGPGAARGLRALVTAQVALALVLSTGAALLVQSFIGLTTAPTGAEPDRVLVATIAGALAGDRPETRFDRLDELRRRLEALPGVDAVSAGIVTPLSAGMAAAPLEVPGSRYEPPIQTPLGAMSPFNRVLPGFFEAVGTPVVRGRSFDDADGPGSPPVLVVNQAFADQHFGDADPLGRVVIMGGVTFTIVGVTANARQMSLREERPVSMAYGLITQAGATGPIGSLRFVLRTATPDVVRTPVIAAVRDVDPRLHVEFRTMRDEADATVNRERLLAWLGTTFAALGLIMAVVGLYGTYAYAVVRRRAEIGLRMALGATRGDVVRLILREAGLVLAAGVALGLAGAAAGGRFVESQLVGIGSRDPVTWALCVAAVAVAAMAASALPARRAANVDPAVALRDE